MGQEVDLVVSWVDGTDPEWRRVKSRYEEGSESRRETAWRDWGLLRYWFRGVEANLPWIRKIHFVTWGHLPSWLDTGHPRLSVVRHEEFIPEEYLPVFSANPIELNLHRIEGLAEQFLYANDDMYFLGLLPREYYFQGGKPCDFLMLRPITEVCTYGFGHILWNNIACINRHFVMKDCMERHRELWFHPSYSQEVLRRNRLEGELKYFPGFYETHMPIPFLKSSFEKVWDRERKLLRETCLHRFRSIWDVSDWLIRDWQLVEGNFIPRMADDWRLVGTDSPPEQLRDAILSTKYHVICFNEGLGEIDFEERSAYLQELFAMVFPHMSSFERF